MAGLVLSLFPGIGAKDAGEVWELLRERGLYPMIEQLPARQLPMFEPGAPGGRSER